MPNTGAFPAKGLTLIARLIQILAGRRPDIPIQVVELRGCARDLDTALRVIGSDLTQHPNLRVVPNVLFPREIYASTRVLLMPSVWEEPAGRAPIEAMMNGIPAIVSDRGGLPEVCRDGAMVLPIPPHIQPYPVRPASAQDIQAWADVVIRLWDDPAFYANVCTRAAETGRSYHPSRVSPQYAAYFQGLLDNAHVHPCT